MAAIDELALLCDLPDPASVVMARRDYALLSQGIYRQDLCLMAKERVHVSSVIQTPQFDRAIIRSAIELVGAVSEGKAYTTVCASFT